MSQPIKETDVPELLADLKRREFFGKVEMEYNRGQLKLIRVAETKIVEGETYDARYNPRNAH